MIYGFQVLDHLSKLVDGYRLGSFLDTLLYRKMDYSPFIIKLLFSLFLHPLQISLNFQLLVNVTHPFLLSLCLLLLVPCLVWKLVPL
jgi:hypothetical protein